jgi:hypothetical protein
MKAAAMTDDEPKQQFVVQWAARVFSASSCQPLPSEDVKAILEATRLELKVPESAVAQHLAGIKSLLSVLDASRNRYEELKAEQEAAAEVRKLISELYRKLKALSDPGAPLSRAVRKGAYFLALEEGRLPPLSFRQPETLQTSRDYARSLLALGEAFAEQEERFGQLQQQEAAHLPGEMKRLLDTLKYYDSQTEAPSGPRRYSVSLEPHCHRRGSACSLPSLFRPKVCDLDRPQNEQAQRPWASLFAQRSGDSWSG